jgi:hypothetical protein
MVFYLKYLYLPKRKEMGRIKDLVIELQNEYGFELENMPEDFSMDDYLNMRAEEMLQIDKENE